MEHTKTSLSQIVKENAKSFVGSFAGGVLGGIALGAFGPESVQDMAPGFFGLVAVPASDVLEYRATKDLGKAMRNNYGTFLGASAGYFISTILV